MAKYELPKDLMAFWQPNLVKDAREIANKLPREEVGQNMVHASEFMSFLPWRGAKKTALQNLSWPRTGVILDDGTLVPDNIVPDKVKECSIIISYFIGAKVPCDLPAMAHVMITVGHLLIEDTDLRKGDIRPWNNSVH